MEDLADLAGKADCLEEWEVVALASIWVAHSLHRCANWRPC